jgi:hypothetical protein
MTLGVSFSTKYCAQLGLDWQETFLALIEDLGVKRVRLMSYWDDTEPQRQKFDFSKLDWQMEQCANYGVAVSLCVGLRQPRYPECHPPQWATKLTPDELHAAIVNFNHEVVLRYKHHSSLASWQLENEALNRGIGHCYDFSRQRLRAEFTQLKSLDPDHPVLMSTSNSFGLPLRRPIPDIIGFSLYRSQYDYAHGRPTYSRQPAWWQRFRALVAKLVWRRPVVIHELQAEPWGRRATSDLSDAEQDQTMNLLRLARAIGFARATGIAYADLWGAEWWYWRKSAKNDDAMWLAVRTAIQAG